MEKRIKLFEQQKVRTHWDEKEEKYHFSISDVIAILSESIDPLAYWRKLKERLKKEGNETVTNSLERVRENWQKLGRSEKWIQQRMTGQETRNKLTDYWKESGVEKLNEFAFLTNIIHTEWVGLSVKQHKNLIGLKLQRKLK